MTITEQIQSTYLIRFIGELIAPTRCAGCEKPGTLLCPVCTELLTLDYLSGQACPKCGGPFGALTCTECWEVEYPFARVAAIGILDGPLARAVVLLKDANERRLAAILGVRLAQVIQELWNDWQDMTICWVPATAKAVRRRGYDHAELIACTISQELELPVRKLLHKSKARDQRDLSRSERLEHSQRFDVIEAGLPDKVLLVDDVFTTGTTAKSAAESLLQAGAREVSVAVLARAW